ncbi:carboxypeptidase M32 [Candidatus Bipolaricaulota bacterium]|nr:carboxypeptidase M32 [Candidatus Bipolaricaulota bacterium]
MDTLTSYKEHLKEMNLLSSALALLSWDQETYMPSRGIGARSQVTGRFTKKLFELSVAPVLGEYLDALAADGSLTLEERASVRDMAKEYHRQKAIPPALIEEHAIVQSQSQAAWVEARKQSDFSVFQPLLTKMVDYARRFADYYGYEEHPYDALLEGFEPGMTVKQLQMIIDPLRQQLVPFMKRLATEGTPPDTSVVEGFFDVDKQRHMARIALDLIGYDFAAGSLDDVAHPFTTAIAFDDVRVTNRYLENLLTSGLFGALHEGGHALYNQGMPENLYALRLSGGSSNGIHESQSRMIENLLGRDLPFWKHFQPILAGVFPQFQQISPDVLYRAVNLVAPSLIRVEADEVTYNLHIMLRAELEASLIAGEIQVADLPRHWNEAMERYLGITPPDDARGVLQDVHWSIGYFGYFPSYMLGNLYAAQMATKIRQDLPDLDERIAVGDIHALTEWVRTHVHRSGGVYQPDELMTRITGAPLDASHFVRYVEEKFSKIYGLS